MICPVDPVEDRKSMLPEPAPPKPEEPHEPLCTRPPLDLPTLWAQVIHIARRVAKYPMTKKDAP